MSESSSNIVRSNLQNKAKETQGGEKKVMKKSLSVVLSTAMALSVFSSVAFADTAATTTTTTPAPATKTSANFTDLKDLDAATKAKFDAMISAGIFDGISDTEFGLKEEMNRAQFAKVAALVMALDINKDLKTSSFSDVKSDDAANGYALPYIEALKTAGVTDGYGEGTYNPAGKVTKEQLATFLVRILGKDAEAKAKTGDDATVDDWAQGYVALALELKLFAAADGGFGGKSNATRDLLLTGAYEAKQQYVPAGKISVASAKATGVKTVVVSFNKAVDTDKAKVALTKGTAAVTTTTKFADDKKSATLTLSDTNLREGEYTVTLSGLDANVVDKTTATFTAQNEVVQKIEFLNASDTIALSRKATVTIKASNQYGEAASFSAGAYSVIVGSGQSYSLTKSDNGTLKLSINTKDKVGGVEPQSNLTVVPVNIYFNDTRVSASKNFTIGVAPFITKLELGEIKYSNATAKAINKKGETATFDLNLYDQYGGLISYDNTDDFDKSKVNAIFTPYDTNITYSVDNYNNDGVTPQLRVSLLKDIEKSADYTAQVYYQGASATTKIAVKSAAVATKVEIGEFSDVIANGDIDVYIPLNAYDENGNKLSIEDLTSDTNVARINVTVSGANADATILNSGEHKGTIHLKNVTAPPKSVVNVTAYIATSGASSTATKPFTVANARVADHLKIATEPAKKMVPGADSKFVLQVIDQYGKSIDDQLLTDSNGNVLTNSPTVDTAGAISYYVRVVPTGDTSTFNGTTGVVTSADKSVVKYISNDDDAHPNNATVAQNTYAYNLINVGTTASPMYAAQTKQYDKLNDTARLYVGSNVTTGTIGFTATLYKKVAGSAEQQISQITRTADIVTSTDSLTYSLNTVPNLFNALDSGVIQTMDYWYGDENTVAVPKTVYENEQKNKDLATYGSSKLSREITVSATAANGDTVALPKSITAVGSSNTSVAQVVYYNNKAYVIGNKAGTANLTITYRTNDNKTKTVTTAVTVKNDAIGVDKVSFDDSSKTRKVGSSAFATVNITDSYGVTYEDEKAAKYNYLLGTTFSITNVKGATGAWANVDNYGVITGQVGTTFDLTITAPSGKSATQAVTLN